MNGQEIINWDLLADVEFESEYSEEFGINMLKAQFGPLVMKMSGEEIAIKGYVIPLDALGISYALSKNPNASCFFCGSAGPETVLQLKFKPSKMKRYQTDTMITIKGKLLLNESNSMQFFYVLEDAEEI